MKAKLNGGCTCGAIRYATSAEPAFTLICQCRQCQRITGTGHAAQFAVEAGDAAIEGEPEFYDLTADSGNTVSSGFCSTCGSPVLKKTTKMPDMLFFHAGSLDDPSEFKPQMVVYGDSAQPWDCVDPEIPRK